MTVETNDIDCRVKSTIDYFEQGYNCSQVVFMSNSDKYNIDAETAAK